MLTLLRMEKPLRSNAIIKASSVQKYCATKDDLKDAIVLADDSGLEIDYLNKEPGVYSARYMGEDILLIKKIKFIFI